MVVAACRRAGHDVILLNLTFEGDTESASGSASKSFVLGVVGISVRNVDDQNMDAPKFLLPSCGKWWRPAAVW